MDQTRQTEQTERRDQFEQRLAHLMHSAPGQTPFEPRHRERLMAGVRARRRARAARRAAGSVLVACGLVLGLLLLPDTLAGDGSGPADPRPASTPSRPEPSETSDATAPPPPPAETWDATSQDDTTLSGAEDGSDAP
ncbi:cellulase [Streptomyces millisiae]|uniref:Cellulase n=1 Tax=Streptomyces millisiae TaxID=3075542 RepID=A0ABU2LYJ6_9ACTN|nr:cellulase [Streptomyces sp. DSM 44918]MDT0322651.1 cellulase [Streptomyces sp. DSM 44918]